MGGSVSAGAAVNAEIVTGCDAADETRGSPSESRAFELEHPADRTSEAAATVQTTKASVLD
jgi:hypothetical protein